MTEPTAVEVMPKVLVRERIPTTPTPRSAEALAQKVAQKVQEGAWRQGLEELARKPQIEVSKFEQKQEEIGIERDPKTGEKVRSGEEEARYKEFGQTAELVKKFLDKGYDGMSDPEKTALRDVVLREVYIRPALLAEFSSLPANQQQAFLERLLKDPKYSSEARKILEERILNPENKLGDVTQEQDVKEQAEGDLTDAKAERADLDRLLGLNDKRLAEFEARVRTPGARPVRGAKLQELEQIAQDMKTTQTSLTNARDRLRTAQTSVRGSRDELDRVQRTQVAVQSARSAGDIQRDLTQAENVERIAQQDVERFQGQLRNFEETQNRLEDERVQLLERQKELDTQERQLDRKVRDAEGELTKRQWALEDAKNLRVTQEQDLVNSMGNIFTEATGSLFNEQLQAAEQQFNAELESLKQQTADQNEKAIYDALQQRWIRVETRMRGILRGKKETVRPIDRAKVDADFNVLMTEGPEAVMRGLLTSRINPATGASYTQAEANEILSNKGYVAKLQPEVMKQLLARKLLTGGISEEDIHVITNAQWGQEMIQGALDKNQAFRDAVDKVMGAEGVSRQNFLENFAQHIRKKPWLLLLLLGLPLLLTGAGFMAAKQVT